jgi:nucleoside-diphosphate-sugar epimerase
VQWIQADLLQPETYLGLLEGKDFVVHCAGLINSRRPEDYFKGNVLATQRLLEACINAGAPNRRFLHMSSIAAMGANHSGGLLKESDACHPESEYGKSKLQAEAVAVELSRSVPLVMIRPSFVYGIEDKRGLSFLESYWNPVPSLANSIIRTFSVCHVSDLIRGCLLSMEKEVPSGEVFILSDPEIHTWSSAQVLLKKIICEILPSDLWPIEGPNEGIPERLLAANLPAEIQQFWGCDISKAQRALGFLPKVLLPGGAREVIQWYMNEGLLPPQPRAWAAASAEE